jgi:tetratricopeptide (TPR) repeat protein
MHFMHSLQLACAIATVAALLPAVAAADDRAVCDHLGSPRDAAIQACSRILAAGGLDARETASTLVSRGLHYWRNDRDKALADIDAAIELKPDLARAWWARGYFNQSMHDLRKDPELRARIIADFSKAIELDPNDVEIYYHRAGIYSNYEQDHDRAIADYTKMIALDPKHRAARHARASSYGRKGDFERQLADLSELVRLYPGRDSLIDRGMFYLAHQDYDHAVADLIEARKLDPHHPSPLSGLAIASTARGDYPQALALYEQAIRQAPHLTWLYRNRAETYLNMGEPDKALDDVQRSLAVFRRDASALNQRGRIYEAMGRKQDAIADFRAALALDQGAKANADSRAGLQRLGVEP